MREYPAYLILAVFIASGISFFDGLFARIFVRVATMLVGILGSLVIAANIVFGIEFSGAFGAQAFSNDNLRLLGDGVLILYLGVSTVACLPIVPARRLRTIGLVLHFGVMPIAAFLTTFSAVALPWEIRLAIFAHTLSLGMIYAMLWFRMAEKQRHVALPPLPVISDVSKNRAGSEDPDGRKNMSRW